MIPELLFEITDCNNFQSNNSLVDHCKVCSKITSFQNFKLTKEQVQLPEPWNGDILNAPILFVSSNPSFSSGEIYPTTNWPQKFIADYFINRFKNRGSEFSWVFNLKPLNNDGSRAQSVRYWSSINNRAGELLGRKAVPGIDYCITEIVHCKSYNEVGVRDAWAECSASYLDKIIKISGAKIIVSIGSLAENHFSDANDINGIPILYLPHPNAFKPKTFKKCYSEDDIEKFKSIITKNRTKKNEIVFSDIELPTEVEIQEFILKKRKIKM